MNNNNLLFTKKVSEEHKDMMGHINHSHYLEYLEEARWHLYKHYGYSYSDILSENKGPIVVEIKISYRKELLAGETISVISRCREYRGYLGIMDQKILKEGGRIACRAVVHFAYFDLLKRKMVLPQGKWSKIHQDLLNDGYCLND